MAECEWCDRPMCPLSALDLVPTHYNYSFEERLGPCKRGPIERELRAYDWAAAIPSQLSQQAKDVFWWAVDSLSRPGEAMGYDAMPDIASEAIEAAAALGL